MKRKILLSLFILFVAFSAFSQTNVKEDEKDKLSFDFLYARSRQVKLRAKAVSRSSMMNSKGPAFAIARADSETSSYSLFFTFKDDLSEDISKLTRVDDAPSADPNNGFVFQETQEYTFDITGITPGSNASQAVSVVAFDSFDSNFINLSDITIAPGTSAGEVKVTFETASQSTGLTTLVFRLFDGFLPTFYSVRVAVHKPNTVPIVESEPETETYVDLSYEYIPAITDDGLTQLSLNSYPGFIELDSVWRGGTFLDSENTTNSTLGVNLSDWTSPEDMVFDSQGNAFLIDLNNLKVVKIDSDGVVTDFVGGTYGDSDGTGAAAEFKYPRGLAIDKADNIYLTDFSSNRLVKISPQGVATTVIGEGSSYGNVDGPASQARLEGPFDVSLDSEGNVFIADKDNEAIRILDGNGNVTTYVDDNTTNISWIGPSFIDVNSKGEVIASDGFSDKIWKINEGIVEEITLPLSTARAHDIAYYTDDVLVFADNPSRKVYFFDLKSRELTLLAGATSRPFEEGGLASEYSPHNTSRILVRKGRIYLSEFGTNKVRVYYPSFSKLTGQPLPGDEGIYNLSLEVRDLRGLAAVQSFQLTVNPSDKVEATNVNQNLTYLEDEVADLENIVISGTQTDEVIEVSLLLEKPYQGVLSDDSGNGESFVQETGRWFVSGTQSIVNAALAAVTFIPVANLATDTKINVKVILENGVVPNEGVIVLDVKPVNDELSLESLPTAVAYSEIPYQFDFDITDVDDYSFGLNPQIIPDWLRLESFSTVSTWAGQEGNHITFNGSLENAYFNRPRNAVLGLKGEIFVLEENLVRRVDKDGQVETFAGNRAKGDFDGSGTNAYFGILRGLDIDDDGNLYVGDHTNRKIKRIDQVGNVTTIAGNGSNGSNNGTALNASFFSIHDVTVDSEGNVYILDAIDRRIRKLTKAGEVSTVTGVNRTSSREGPLTSFAPYSMISLAVDLNDNLLVGAYNHIYHIDFEANNATVLVGSDFARMTDGILEEAEIEGLSDVFLDRYGDIYFADKHALRLIRDGEVTTLVGQNGPGIVDGRSNEARLKDVTSLTNLQDGSILFTEDGSALLRRIHINKYSLNGVPSAEHIGANPLKIQFSEDGEDTYLLDMVIDVLANDMPVINGLDQVFNGTEDALSIDITGISISEAGADSILVEFTLSDPSAGSFPSDDTAGATFDEASGKWTIKSVQASINTLFSELKFNPSEDFNGNINVQVTAKRLDGLFTREGSFAIKLKHVNDLPELNLDKVDLMVDLPLDLTIELVDADMDPVNLEVEGLPEGVRLEADIQFSLSTIADLQYGNSADRRDGHISQATVQSAQKFTVDSVGNYYMADLNSIRVLTNDSLKTLIDFSQNDPQIYAIRGIIHDGVDLFVFDYARLFRLDGTEFILIAGDASGQRGDREGDALSARFDNIKSIVPDGNGGFYIADSGNRKIKYLKDGQVSTFAGNGDYGVIGTPNGASLETAFASLDQLWLNKSGDVLVMEQDARRIRKITNGMVETVLPKSIDEYLPEFSHFSQDAFDNTFTFQRQAIFVFGKDGAQRKMLTVPSILADGAEGEFGWSSLSDIYRKSTSSFVLWDNIFRDFRELSYQYKYRLVGTPLSGSEGNSTLTFKLKDGIGDEVSYEVPLAVVAPDAPIVLGLPQDINYVEGDQAMNITPIILETDDSNELFEVTIALSKNELGDLTSSQITLEDLYTNGVYLLEGNKTLLNEILASLSFLPATDNDKNGSIEFSILRKGGQLAYTGTVNLNVTAVNDLPIIETSSEAVVYSGDSLSLSVDVFDVEDGNNLDLVLSDKPEWVTKQVITGRDELIAGKPGGQGLKDGVGENALFTNPSFVTIDNNGDLLVSSYGSHTVVKIDQDRIVKRVASEGKAGLENGEALKSKFNSPEGIAVDLEGNIYVADRLNRVIRKISVDGSVSTIAGSGDQGQLDGTGEEASFISPRSLVFSNDKQTLFIGDHFGIRKLDINTMQVSTLLLNYSVVGGYASDMRLLITKNDQLLVSAQNQIVVFNMSGQAIALYGSVYGGYLDGYVSTALFSRITGIAEDEEGNIYILDSGNSLIRKLDMSSLLVSTIAGNQGAEGYSSGINTGIQLNAWGNLIYHDGALLFADTRNHVVRKLHLNELALTGKPAREDVGEYDLRLSVQDSQNGVTSKDLKITVLEGDRPAVKGLDTLLIVSEESDQAILPKIELLTEPGELIEIELSLEGDLVATVGRDQQNTWSFDETHAKWTFEGTTEQVNEELGELKVFSESFTDANLNFEFRKQEGNLSFTGTICLIASPVNDSPVLISDNVYEVMVGETFEFDIDVTDEDSEVFSITSDDFPEWMSTDSVWIIQPFVESIYSEKLPASYKDSLRISANDLALNSRGELFMASGVDNRVLQILGDGTMVPFAGSGASGYLDGDKDIAEFDFLFSIAFDAQDNLLISDQWNHRIRMINQDGVVSTVAGTGQYGRQDGPGNEATLASPYNIRFDSEGNLIIAGRDQIAKMDASYNVSALVGKLGEYADIDGDVAEARLGLPYSVVPMSDGSLVISEYAFRKVKKLDQGELSTISGNGIRAYADKNLLESSFQSVGSMIELGPGQIMVTDYQNHAVRLLDIDKDTVMTVAGKGYYGNDFGLALNSALANPNSLIQLPNGDILVAEWGTGRIKRMALHVPEISGTPTENQIGEHKFRIRISDGKDGIIEEEITINVIPANTAPTATAIADITETYAVDGAITIPLFDYFSDAEDADSELTYEVVSNTDNTVVTSEAVDSSDGLLVLNIENVGTTQLEVKATDSNGASVSTSFAVTMEQAVATISITNTEFVNDGDEKAVTVTTDPVGLSYTITYDGINEAPSAIGIYEVLVSLDERNYSGTATAQLSIVNVAPEDLTLSGLTVFENQETGTAVGTLTVTDQNPVDTHSYFLPAGVTDNDLFSVSGTTLSATEIFDFETKDEYMVTIKVEDDQGGSYEEVFTITVLDVNDAPGVSAPAPIEVVKDLGSLSFTVSGLNTGGEAGQTLTLSTATTGVLASASVVDNADGTAMVTFESANGQDGTGNIQLTVKDDGGTENGGVDTYVLDIPVTVSPANLTAVAAGNCGPGQVTLSASGADAYSWYTSALGGEAVGTGVDFTAEVTASTTYYVAGTFSGEESLLRVPVLASVYDLPETPVIINNAEVLSVTEVVGAAYNWFRNGIEIPDVSGASFSPTESGGYTVMITNANSCTALSDVLSVIITGVEEDVPAIEVTVYPVPTSDYIFLSFAEVMRKGTQIRLLDNNGRELTSLVMPVAGTKARLDVRSFASGIHFVTVQDGDKLVRKRVMIKK